MEALLGRSCLLKVKKAGCAILFDGSVCPLQMVVMRGAGSHDLGLLVLQRRCAIVCDRGGFATYIIFPMVLSSSKDMYRMVLTKSDVSAIYFQVKNWRDGDSLSSLKIDDIFKKMNSFAEDLFSRVRYSCPLTPVSEGAVYKDERDRCA